ncbi:hypothetical protein [Streptomyces werraensis]|uniref:hypothetical protein n=1 Tax=Streptomyces werraensis TaxID=68284 RepID=UPI0034213543
MSLPEIWIGLSQDVDLAHFEDEDAAAIRAGELAVYDIAIIEPRTDENWDAPEDWVFLDSCGSYYGAPGHDNVYSHPQRIGDEWLRYYATDMWMYRLGIRAGDLLLHQGQVHAVLGFECEPVERDPIGYATGHLVCRPAGGGAPVRVTPADPLRLVLELTAPKCSTIGCHAWATHTLWTDNPDPVPYEPEREREPVCEPCGTEYTRTNRIKRLNGALTKGTA